MLGRSAQRPEIPSREMLKCEILRAVYDYWLEKRGDRFAPSRLELWPEEITRLLPYVMLMDVIGTPPRYRYRLVGTAFVTEYGKELTGRFVDEIDLAEQKEFILADYDGIVRSGMPSFSRWEYRMSAAICVRCERVLLPLSGDGNVVNMLFGAVTARDTPPERPGSL